MSRPSYYDCPDCCVCAQPTLWVKFQAASKTGCTIFNNGSTVHTGATKYYFTRVATLTPQTTFTGTGTGITCGSSGSIVVTDAMDPATCLVTTSFTGSITFEASGTSTCPPIGIETSTPTFNWSSTATATPVSAGRPNPWAAGGVSDYNIHISAGVGSSDCTSSCARGSVGDITGYCNSFDINSADFDGTYADCSNVTTVYTYSSEYTPAMMLAAAEAALPAYGSPEGYDWTPAEDFAYYYYAALYAIGGQTCSIQNCEYYFTLDTALTATGCYKLTWDEVTFDLAAPLVMGSPPLVSTNSKEYTWNGTDTQTPTYDITFPYGPPTGVNSSGQPDGFADYRTFIRNVVWSCVCPS